MPEAAKGELVEPGTCHGQDAVTGILIVEDERISAKDIELCLRGMSYSVLGVCGSGDEAIDMARRHSPGLVLMDILLQGGMDGIEAASVISHEMDIPVVYLTAHTDEAIYERAKLTQPYGYLVKPFDERELKITIEMALYKHRAEGELRRTRERFRNLLEYAADAFIVHGEDGRIMDVNNYACTVLGHERERLVGADIAEFLGEGQMDRLRPVWASVAPGAHVTVETELVHQGGERFPVEVRLGLLEAGAERIYIVTARDITARKRLQAEREELISELTGALDKVKSMKGMLPVCVIRSRFTKEAELERLIQEHYDNIMQRGICPACLGSFKRLP